GAEDPTMVATPSNARSQASVQSPEPADGAPAGPSQRAVRLAWVAFALALCALGVAIVLPKARPSAPDRTSGTTPAASHENAGIEAPLPATEAPAAEDPLEALPVHIASPTALEEAGRDAPE